MILWPEETFGILPSKHDRRQLVTFNALSSGNDKQFQPLCGSWFHICFKFARQHGSFQPIHTNGPPTQSGDSEPMAQALFGIVHIIIRDRRMSSDLIVPHSTSLIIPAHTNLEILTFRDVLPTKGQRGAQQVKTAGCRKDIPRIRASIAHPVILPSNPRSSL